jgi:hypothetical protein
LFIRYRNYITTEDNQNKHMKLVWRRRIPEHCSNFDLSLVNSEDLDRGRMHELLEAIMKETHRRLTLSGRAYRELKTFFDSPTSALRASSYALLSNWFTTRGGDRNSMVASRCEALWDELFQSRPLERLTSPTAGQNHIVLASEFASFWARLSKAQGNSGAQPTTTHDNTTPMNTAPVNPSPVANTRSASAPPVVPADDKLVVPADGEAIHAVITKDGLHIDVTGSPQAIASFLDQ